jgi:hypothetical protein
VTAHRDVHPDAYAYGPQTDAERAANDQAMRDAVAIIAASYRVELAGRNLTYRLKQEQDKAARLARWLAHEDTKRGNRP